MDKQKENIEVTSEFSENITTRKRLNKIERRLLVEKIRSETNRDRKRKTSHHCYTRAQIDLDSQKANKQHKTMSEFETDDYLPDMEDVDNPGLSTVDTIDESEDEEIQMITIPEDEKDKPLTAGAFVDALNKQTKNLSDMHTKAKTKLYAHVDKVTTETIKNTNRIASMQREIKDMRDSLHDTVDSRLQKQLQGQLTFEFRRKLENDIARTKKNMFYSVSDTDSKTPEELITDMIKGLKLADRQVDSIKNMTVTLDPSSALNRQFKTRNVRVAFPTIDDKKAVWIAMIKETKIRWPVKMRDDFSDDYKSKAKEFERKLKNLKNIQGGKTELIYDGVELQARQTINDVTNICMKFTPTDPNFVVKSQTQVSTTSNPSAPKPMTNNPIDQQTKDQNNRTVVVNIKPDVTDTDRIEAIKTALIDVFVNSNTKAVSAKKGNKCFLVLFSSIKDANEASKHLNGLNPKPFTECKFTHVPRL